MRRTQDEFGKRVMQAGAMETAISSEWERGARKEGKSSSETYPK